MIEIKNVSKTYNGEICIKNVSASINDGDFISMVGESGSGKTTLLGIISAERIPDEGYVLYDSRNIFEMSDKELSMLRMNELGIVYQSSTLLDTLSVLDNILFPLSISGRLNDERKERCLELARELKVYNCLNQFPSELSGGQRQRVALVRALSCSPKYLLMDEVTGSLDSENTLIVMELLKKINKEEGTTILHITHNRDLSKYGNKVWRIRDGEIDDESIA